MIRRILTAATDRIHALPIIVLMPHSRCNCKCVMCDIWKANHEKREISAEDLGKNIEVFKTLGVREVVLSGGEALMHSNLWRLCGMLSSAHIKITLLSTGLLLQRNAGAIADHINEVIISLDGSEPVHDGIRNVPQGFKRISEGIAALKSIRPGFPVSGRCVLHRHNYFDFVNIVRSAGTIGLDHISFLAADIFSNAFNRPDGWDNERAGEIALDAAETAKFESIIKDSFIALKQEYASRFIVESPEKMLKIVRYYKAVNGLGAFPRTECNAPWVSAVIESDGSVLPCFFHKPYGNIFQRDLLEILNAPEAIAFRRNLDVRRDEICRKCVCSLKLGFAQMN